MDNEQQELFRLPSGRYIDDTEISRKLFFLQKEHPESNQYDSTNYTWDEPGMADLFRALYEDTDIYCIEKKCWYVYKDGYWKKDIGSHDVSNDIKEFVTIMSLYASCIEDDDIRSKYQKFINKMGDRRFRDRLLKDCGDLMKKSINIFDSNPYLINLQNGTFNLKNFTFKPHDPADYITFMSNANSGMMWQNYNAPRWRQFINEVTQNDRDKATYLQKALGYSLLGKANEECMFLLHGKTTRNGKSTMLNTIEQILGDYSTSAPVGLICKTRGNGNAESASPTLARLKGKRFVTMAESESSGKLDESVIKQYTGGEEITARELYSTPFTYTPQFTLWLSCNDLPQVTDKSLFASDRLRVIEFNRHFTQAEQDKDLKTKLLEPEEVKGIFTWLVHGYMMYTKTGLTMPGSMQKVIEQYEIDNDLIMQFLDDCTEKAHCDSKILLKSLYERYKRWCKNNDFKPYGIRKFSIEMDKHPEYFEDVERGKGNVKMFTGIKFLNI